MEKGDSFLRCRRRRPSNSGSAAAPAHIRSAKHFGALAATLIFGCLPVSAAAQGVCEHEPILTTSIVYDRNGRPMVQAELAGHERYLLLDTGGAKSILDPETARELALRIGQFGPASESPFERGASAPREAYIDVTGRRSSSFVNVEDLQLGERNFGAIEFIVSPIGQNQDDLSSPVGTLGADFMIAYDVAFDFGADVFQIFAQSPCESSPFSDGIDAGTSIAVPFTTNRSNHMEFPLRLDGQMLMAVLDTGAHDTILSLPVAQSVFSIDLNGPDVIRAGEIAGLDIASMYRRRFSSLQIETLLLLDPMIFLLPDLIAPRAPPQDRIGILRQDPEENAVLPDFILGMSVLGRYRLYISYGQRKFYLAPVPSG
jgi:predicted aspartyl protease